jgi:hypothetical protein
VFQILVTPSEIPIVEFIFDRVKTGDLALFGSILDPSASGNDVRFELHWSESVRLICFLFLGTLSVFLLAGVIKVLISSGIELIKLAKAPAFTGKTENPQGS